jgi:hypothetical protein
MFNVLAKVVVTIQLEGQPMESLEWDDILRLKALWGQCDGRYTLRIEHARGTVLSLIEYCEKLQDKNNCLQALVSSLENKNTELQAGVKY